MTASVAGVGSAGTPHTGASESRQPHNQYQPDVVSRPGVTIRETLEAQGKDWRALHVEGGLAEQFARCLVEGNARITVVAAEALECTTGVAVSFWLRRQELYDAYVREVAS